MTKQEYIEQFSTLDIENDSLMIEFASKVQKDYLQKNNSIQDVQFIFDKTINKLSDVRVEYISNAIFNEEY